MKVWACTCARETCNVTMDMRQMRSSALLHDMLGDFQMSRRMPISNLEGWAWDKVICA